MSLRASSGRTQFWGLTIQKGPWKETRPDKRNEMTSLGNKTFFGGGVQGAGKIHAGHAGAFTAMDPVGTPNWGNYPQPMPGPSRYAQAEVTTSSAPTQYTRQLPPGKQYLQTKANLLGLPKGSIQQAGAVGRQLEQRTPAAMPGPENADADTMNTGQLVRDEQELVILPGAFPVEQRPNFGPIVTGYHPVAATTQTEPLISHTFGVQTEQPQFSHLSQQTDDVLQRDDLINALYEVNAEMDQNVRRVFGAFGFDPTHREPLALTGGDITSVALRGHAAINEVLIENGLLKRQLQAARQIEEIHDEQVERNTDSLVEQAANTANIFDNLRHQSLYGHAEDLPSSSIKQKNRDSKYDFNKFGPFGAKRSQTYFPHEYRGGDPAVQGGSVAVGNPVGRRRKFAPEAYLNTIAKRKTKNVKPFHYRKTTTGYEPLSLKEMAAERVRLQEGQFGSQEGVNWSGRRKSKRQFQGG